jgi:pyruvate/2-oxoglutarate dehydrogenase complex dihydrolipoamide dehydrogenase (E3) component
MIRFAAAGVRVIEGSASFADRATVVVAGCRIKARRVLIACGARAPLPAIEGLAGLPVLTPGDVLDLEAPPARLIVIGGGPEALAFAQAFRRFGSEVVLAAEHGLLPGEEPELAAVLARALAADGVQVAEGVRLAGAAAKYDGLSATLSGDDGVLQVDASHLLFTGPGLPFTEGLALEAADIRHETAGIICDATMRTTNPKVFAIGLVAGMAGGEGDSGPLLRNMLFRGREKRDPALAARIALTNPEFAAIGLSEHQARAQGQRVETLRFPFSETPRAIAEGTTAGMVKLVLGRKGLILGAGIAGPQASELLAPFALALRQGLPATALAGAFANVPTHMAAGTSAAALHLLQRARSPWTRLALKFNRWLG